ncbi:L-aspartate oxidase [Natronospora cellulosivora (SeqCode)]
MTDSIEYINTDFLIVGSGIAGLYTALKLSNLGSVLVLTKEQIEDSNTQFAQGGIAAVLDKGDSWQLHMKDTLQAGAGICNPEAVQVLVTEGPARVKELIKLGTKFDHIEGELSLTKEGAHSRRRILHARGDATGVEIRESLTRMLHANENIELRENAFMVDLLTAKDNPSRVAGAWAIANNKHTVYKARAIILASGGCSRVYLNTSNPEVTTGDGIAAAYRAGADIMDMEFIQFHPTTFYNPEASSFLISESVRGEGAVLRNKEGKRFMPDYHPQADLAPRDVVARAIVNEARKDGKAHVCLDARDLGDDYIESRFPTIFKTLYKSGFDMRKELIPVVPAAHYSMGGILTDTYGRTSLEGLYACGEVACTAVHGANRLASNSLLEGLVFGHRIYASLKGEIEKGSFFTERNVIAESIIKDKLSQFESSSNTDYRYLRNEFRALMSKKAGIERNADCLKELLNWLENKEKEIKYYQGLKALELQNILINGTLIAKAALFRKESRGGHYRNDYKHADKSWSRKHIVFNKNKPEGEEYVLE